MLHGIYSNRICIIVQVSSQDPNNAAASVDLVMSRSINTLHAAAHNGRPPFAVVPSDSLLACEAAIKDLMSLALDKNVMYKNDFVKGLISTEVLFFSGACFPLAHTNRKLMEF